MKTLLLLLLASPALAATDAQETLTRQAMANQAELAVKGGGIAADENSSNYGTNLNKGDFRNWLLPDDCGKPFQDVPAHTKFFDSAISSMAISRGPQSKGLPELFAVAEMRTEFEKRFPNMAEENPLNRLLIAQLCHFKDAKTAQLKPGSPPSKGIQAFDDEIHEHLSTIAPKLYRDARTILVQSLAQQSKLKEVEARFRDRWGDVLKARQAGRAKVSDILK